MILRRGALYILVADFVAPLRTGRDRPLPERSDAARLAWDVGSGDGTDRVRCSKVHSSRPTANVNPLKFDMDFGSDLADGHYERAMVADVETPFTIRKASPAYGEALPTPREVFAASLEALPTFQEACPGFGEASPAVATLRQPWGKLQVPQIKPICSLGRHLGTCKGGSVPAGHVDQPKIQATSKAGQAFPMVQKDSRPLAKLCIR